MYCDGWVIPAIWNDCSYYDKCVFSFVKQVAQQLKKIDFDLYHPVSTNIIYVGVTDVCMCRWIVKLLSHGKGRLYNVKLFLPYGVTVGWRLCGGYLGVWEQNLVSL